MEENKSEHWFDCLSQEQQEDILEGLKEADAEQTIDHSEVVILFEKYGLR